jgi:hypothetical protein
MTEEPKTAVIAVQDLTDHPRVEKPILVYQAKSDSTGLEATLSDTMSIDTPEVRTLFDDAKDMYDPADYEHGTVLAEITFKNDQVDHVDWK